VIALLHPLADAFASAQAWLFETVVQPAMYYAGLGEYIEDAFGGTEWFLVGVCELALLWLVLRPLEAVVPVHRIAGARARWNDFIYTVVHRLGAFAVAMFFLLDPLVDRFNGFLHLHGLHPFEPEQLWPALATRPLALFLVYLVVLDFFEYWYHRAQHGIGWWWGLHSLHHSQRDMNLWSDDRNHLLDGLLHDLFLAAIAVVIGVPPGQYLLLVSVSRILQSLQHANVRIHFGRVGERLLVSPRFHRLHHAIGFGHESHGRNSFGGHNFAVLFPVWDIVFGTARFGSGFAATGVRDQLPPPEGRGRDYGSGFWSQQWLGLERMVEFARRRRPAGKGTSGKVRVP
jgi:sterol desaturase/sphingolipid hydroxylase (fatty acid hydroxylase superfamily)